MRELEIVGLHWVVLFGFIDGQNIEVYTALTHTDIPNGV